MGTTTHHLNMLEQQQFIRSAQDGMYRRFYPYGMQPDHKLILSDIQTKIVEEIKLNPGISQVNIARNIGVARKVVNYHIKILADAGFIYVETIGRESACYYKGDT
jgi:predicted transcriptional regulator